MLLFSFIAFNIYSIHITHFHSCQCEACQWNVFSCSPEVTDYQWGRIYIFPILYIDLSLHKPHALPSVIVILLLLYTMQTMNKKKKTMTVHKLVLDWIIRASASWSQLNVKKFQNIWILYCRWVYDSFWKIKYWPSLKIYLNRTISYQPSLPIAQQEEWLSVDYDGQTLFMALACLFVYQTCQCW